VSCTFFIATQRTFAQTMRGTNLAHVGSLSRTLLDCIFVVNAAQERKATATFNFCVYLALAVISDVLRPHRGRPHGRPRGRDRDLKMRKVY
jgi:hypothetical protein